MKDKEDYEVDGLTVDDLCELGELLASIYAEEDNEDDD